MGTTGTVERARCDSNRANSRGRVVTSEQSDRRKMFGAISPNMASSVQPACQCGICDCMCSCSRCI